MSSVALSRGRNGHIRRILIVGLAALLLITTLTIVPGAPLGPQRTEAGDPPTGGDAGSCVADVVFMLERSGSMGFDNNAGRDALRAGFAAFVDGLSDGSKIGSVDFAQSATPAFGGAWKTLPGDKTDLIS